MQLYNKLSAEERAQIIDKNSLLYSSRAKIKACKKLSPENINNNGEPNFFDLNI